MPNYIIAAPLDVVFSNLPDSGCAPFTKSFSAAASTNEPIASYLWNFGDGTTSTLANPSHTFPVGAYNIQLTIVTISGCSATKTLASAIKVGTNPSVNFSATPRIACAKKMINFQDLSTGGVDSWLWSFGDGGSSTSQNPGYLYSDTGKFTVKLVVSNNGCKDSIAFGEYIQILPPIAKFLVPLDCNSRFTKAFIDSSVGADQWRWNFGDGDSSILQNPTHTYQNAGTYTVSLTVINLATGCDHTKTTTLIISNERAAFNVNNSIVCRNVPNAVRVTSTNDSSKVTLYEWNFGDGATTAVGNPITHTYSNAGTYNIRLVITDANGCRDSLVKQNVVKVLGPNANFTAVTPVLCITDTARFSDQTTTDSLYRINLWTFDFGDSIRKNFSAAPFTHLYNTGGIFSVKLTVKDSFGCLDSIVKTNIITVGNPKVNFIAADSMSCPGRPIVFSDSSSGLGLRYNWLFGDGNSSTVASPSHAYADTGTYSVSLTITDAAGCVQTKTRPRYIKIVRPVSNFTVSDTLSTCPPLIVQFTNTSTDTRSLVWDFGDGNTSQSVNPSHFYNVSGTFISSLTVTSAGGCTSVKTQRIVVRGPQGSFSYGPITGCNPLTVTFTASTQDQASFIWDFNDGTTMPTTAPVITHVFNRLGNYLPKMILRDLAGCTVAIEGTDTIIVNGVDAEFMPETTVRCSPGAVQFNNLSVSTEPITGYLWNFGDGITSTEASPLHNYATLGNFIPTLTATSLSGCIDLATLTVPLRVVKTPEISITQTADGCVPITKTFNGNLLNADTAAIDWKWVLNNRDTARGIRLVTPLITNAGQYTATLFAQNSSGCKDTASVNYETFAIPNIAASADAFICSGISQTLSATGGDTYLWSPANTLSCTTCATTIATPTATTSYVVAGTNAKGCTSRDTVLISVQATIVISSGYADTLCTGSFTTLNVTGADSYAWSPPTGLNTTTGNTVRANPTQNIIYMVVGRDDKGCFSDTAYFPISVFPIPTVQLRSDTTITLGESITLTPKFSTDVTSVTWFPLIAVVANNYPSITVQPTSATQYTATVRNIAGCLSSEPVNINVKCSDANAFIPNTFSPNNDGANDVFYPRGTGLYNVKSTRIFNRWGEVVFTKLNYSANDASAGWDGNFKGRQLLPDVYIYIIEIVCQNNTVLLYKGNITLIR